MKIREERRASIREKQRLIIEHYGFDNQLDQLVEECGELIVSIAKNKRYALSESCIDYYDNLIEELADVKNLIQQLELNNDYVRQGIEIMIEHKANRELDRIKRRNKHE